MEQFKDACLELHLELAPYPRLQCIPELFRLRPTLQLLNLSTLLLQILLEVPNLLVFLLQRHPFGQSIALCVRECCGVRDILPSLLFLSPKTCVV